MNQDLKHSFGRNDGFDWKIQVYLNKSGDYYAIVKVGGVVKITAVFNTEEEAFAAGCSLMADTLAFLLDAEHA